METVTAIQVFRVCDALTATLFCIRWVVGSVRQVVVWVFQRRHHDEALILCTHRVQPHEKAQGNLWILARRALA